MNTNYLCIIDGDYKIYKTREEVPPPAAAAKAAVSDSGKNNDEKILELVEFYRQNLSQIGSDENFELVHSKDGAELFAHMLQAFGVMNGEASTSTASTLVPNETADKALSEFSTTMAASGLFDRVSHFTVNSTLVESPSYIAFIVADFDSDHDRVFARLEDAQFKLTNLASLASSPATAATLATLSFASFNFTQSLAAVGSAAQKRFIIVGWPVVYYCIKNELVNNFHFFIIYI